MEKYIVYKVSKNVPFLIGNKIGDFSMEGIMKDDGREFYRYLKWFKELDDTARKGKTAITSSSGTFSNAVAKRQWDDFFDRMEEEGDADTSTNKIAL